MSVISAPPTGQTRVLVARGVDGLLVGWLAVIVWISVFLGNHLGAGTMPGITAIYWTGIVLTAAHFGLSYHLAYSPGGSALRARPFPLVIAPLVLVAFLGG